MPTTSSILPLGWGEFSVKTPSKQYLEDLNICVRKVPEGPFIQGRMSKTLKVKELKYEIVDVQDKTVKQFARVRVCFKSL